MNEKFTCARSQMWKEHSGGAASRRVPGREFAVQRCSDRAQGDARRSPAPSDCRPGRGRPARHGTGTRHAARDLPAPAPPRAPRARTPATRCTLTRPLTATTTTISMCFVKYVQTRESEGGRGGVGTHRAVRGAGPARCVTHLSRSFLACSRSPPSAETCPWRAPRRRPPRLTLRRCECPLRPVHVILPPKIISITRYQIIF